MIDLGALGRDRTPLARSRTCRRTGWAAAALLLLALPGCVAAGPPLVPSDQLAGVFRGLHAPVYSIYELGPDRDAVHDLLAASFAGRQLTREYVEHYSTLVRMEQEQTSIDVRRVDYDRIEPLEIGPDRARLTAEWSVGGVITHGGHKHPRVNRYQAVYTLEQGPDGIRIVSTRLSNLQRIRTPVGSGGGWPFEDEPTSGGGLLDPVDYLMSGMYEDGLEPSPAPAGQPVDPFGIETDAR